MTKYHNRITERDGIRFHSKAEADHYRDLCFRVAAGEISDLRLQPRYPITIGGIKVCTYVGDFEYVENGHTVTVDVKGVRTAEYKLKRKLMWAVHRIDIVEVTA